MSSYSNRALFIGVADYSAYDASVGQEAGSSDLPGARLDALAFWRICRAMGIAPENMRILTSPPLSAELADDIPEACRGEATGAGIQEGLSWLAGELASAEQAPGLWTYAGHGEVVEGQGLAICPSDTHGTNLEGALLLTDIQAMFQSERASANLTVLLDTCFAGNARARAGRRAGSLTGRAFPTALPPKLPALGSRMLAACQPDQVSWRGRFSGVFRGAFSWAAASALEQWSARPNKGAVELDLSYGELTRRTQQLLAALSFEQVPALQGRPGTAATPFFHAGLTGALQQTSATPTAELLDQQLTPDVNYEIKLSWYTQGSWTAYAYGNKPPTSINAQTEYWALDTTFLTELRNVSSNDSLTLSPFSPDGTVTSAPLTNPVASVWTELPDRLFSDGVFVTSDNSTGLAFELDSGAQWTGNMWWFSTNPPSGPLISGTDATSFSYQSELPDGTWYYLKLPALVWATSPCQVGAGNSRSGADMTEASGDLFMATVVKTGGVTVMKWRNPGWTQLLSTTAGAVGAPAIAMAVYAMMLLYQKKNDSSVWQQKSYNDGDTWSSATKTGVSASGSPALANLEGNLVMAYQGASSSQQIYTNMWQGAGWSSNASEGPQVNAKAPPSLATLKDTLYLAILTDQDNVQLFVPTSISLKNNTISWPDTPTATIPFPKGVTWTSVSLNVRQNQLVLALKAGSNVWLCFSSDGVNWSGFQNLTQQVPAMTTNMPPAVGALDETLMVAFNTSGNNGFYTENTLPSFSTGS